MRFPLMTYEQWRRHIERRGFDVVRAAYVERLRLELGTAVAERDGLRNKLDRERRYAIDQEHERTADENLGRGLRELLEMWWTPQYSFTAGTPVITWEPSLLVEPSDGAPHDPGGDGDDRTHEPEQK